MVQMVRVFEVITVVKFGHLDLNSILEKDLCCDLVVFQLLVIHYFHNFGTTALLCGRL